MELTPQHLIAILPLILTGATAILVMISIAVSRNHTRSSWICILGLNLALLSILLPAGQPPMEVTPLLLIDGYACFYTALVLIATLACTTLCRPYIKGYERNQDEIYLLLSLSATGAIVLVSSQHLAAFFIGLELLSVPLFGMVAYRFELRPSLEAGLKYLVLSAAASSFLLFGMALLYAESGTLIFATLGAQLAPGQLDNPVILTGVLMMMVGIGFKLSLVPFHLWTPDVYEGAPAPIGAFLATTSKIAVFAVLMRFFMTVPATTSTWLHELLAVLAVLSILGGNLLALLQSNLKRLLAYSSIAHFGYLLVAVVASRNFAIEAVGVYLLTYTITTLGAFGVIALMSSPCKGRDADALFEYRGLFWKRPYLTAVLTLMMLSLAGIPLTAGFVGKFYVFAVGVESNLWWLLATVVVGSAIGIFYYLRVVVTLYLASPGMRRHDAPLDWAQGVGGIMVLLLGALMLLLGVYPQPALEIIRLAGMALPY